MVETCKPLIAVLVASYSVIAWGDFWDNLMSDGAVRTEYPSGYGTGASNVTLAYTNPVTHTPLFATDYGCLWNSTDPSAGYFKCPGRAGSSSIWQGTVQQRPYCGGSNSAIGDSYQGCLTYSSNTYFSLNSPTTNYWVIHANNDPSFDQCRAGLPGASEFIIDPVAYPATPNLYKIAVETTEAGRKRMNIIVAPWEHSFTCNGSPQWKYPYLSVGAHSNRGNGGAVGTIYVGSYTGSDTINFKAQIRGYANISGKAAGCAGGSDDPCSNPGVHAGMLVTTVYGGVRRMVFLDLYNEGVLANGMSGPFHWSWPLADSMFWPGGEVAVLTGNQISSGVCSFPAQNMLDLGAPGTQVSYSIPVPALLNCAASYGFLSTAPPTGQHIEIESVNWFVEFGQATSGMLWLAIEDPYVNSSRPVVHRF